MRLGGVIEGFNSYLDAWRFTKKHNLWSYFLIPSVISLLIGLSISLLAINTGKYAFDKIEMWLSQDFFVRYEWIQNSLQYIGSVATGLLIVIPSMFLLKYLVIVLNGPFMSPLSEKVERILYGDVLNKRTGLKHFGYSIYRGLRFNISLILRELFSTLLISIILLPVSAISPFVIVMIQSYFAGRGNMDYVLERHMGYKESLNFGKMRKSLALGNGLPFILLLYIPILGFILAPPLSTIAVTRKTLEEIRGQANSFE